MLYLKDATHQILIIFLNRKVPESYWQWTSHIWKYLALQANKRMSWLRIVLWGLLSAALLKAQVTICDFTWGSYFLLFTRSIGFIHADGSVLCSQYVPGANYPFFSDFNIVSPVFPLISCIQAGTGYTFPGFGGIYWFNASSFTTPGGGVACFQMVQSFGGVAYNNCFQRFGFGGLLCARPLTQVSSFSQTQTQVLTSTTHPLVGTSTSTVVQTIAFLTGSTSTSVIVIGTTESFTQTRNVLTFTTLTLSTVTILSTTTTLTDSSLEIDTSSLTLSETYYVTVTQLLIESTTSTQITLTTNCPTVSV